MLSRCHVGIGVALELFDKRIVHCRRKHASPSRGCNEVEDNAIALAVCEKPTDHADKTFVHEMHEVVTHTWQFERR